MKHIAHHNSRAQSSNWPCTFDSPQTAITQTRRSELRPCTWQNPIEGSVVNACSGPYLGKGEPWWTPNRRALCFLSRPRIPWSSIEDLDAVEFILRCFSKGKCFRLRGDSGWVLKLQDAAKQLPVPSSSLVYYPDLPGCAEPVIAKQHLRNHKGLIIGPLQHSSGLRVLEAWNTQTYIRIY